MNKLLRTTLIVTGSLCIWAPTVLAFALYPENGFLGYTYNKWGDPAIPTTATVYWSLMPVGTAGSAYCAPGCTNGSGMSSLTLPNFYDWTTHSFRSVNLTDPDILGYIKNALRSWGAVAGVTFIYVPNDSGVPINDAAAEPPATGQIRIGVFNLGNGSAAAGYAPPPNGFIPNSSQLATGAGDLIINSNYAYQNPAGAEGAHLESFPQGGGLFLNDLEGLILHELGHTLGLDHSNVADAVMCGNPNTCIYNNVATYAINRQPGADDIAGIQTLYGPALDSDGDGLLNALDNCMLVANTEAGVVPGTSVLKYQLDSDGDGYGNACDADLNNSGTVTTGDFSILRNQLNQSYSSSANAAQSDLNGSGTVTTGDFTILRNRLNTAPGPSGWAPP